MAEFRDEAAQIEARELGRLLATLRRALGLSQAEAGARAGMTGQGWGLYETGRRPGVFRPDVRRRLAAALGVPEDRLRAAAPRAAGQPPAQLTLTDDALDPWASAGTIVDYEPGRFPRRGQGCVVEGVDGALSVWLFDGADAGRLHLRGGEGGLDARHSLDRAQVLSVAAVIARRDA